MDKAKSWRLTLLLGVLALALTPALALAQDARGETRLQVAAPVEVPLGNLARIVARLEDAKGAPIPDATIVFTSPAGFAGTVAEMEVGQARTGADGLAVLDYQLRVDGQNQFRGRFYGSGAYRPSEGSAVVTATGTAQLVQRSAGVRLPFLGPWTLILVLFGVWSVYATTLVLVSRIPEAAAPKA